MSIAAQSQAEMTNVVWAVDGLCLAAKDEVIDEGRLWSSRRAAQHPVEQLRFEGLPFGKGETGNACLREKSPQSLHLLRVRRVMHAIHARLVACLELLGGGHICQDHELLDQPMAVEANGALDRHRTPLGIEQDAMFGDIEIECAALSARFRERREG